jgi:hypothetical protein
VSPTTADVLLALAALYGALGVLVGVPFVLTRVQRIDPDARGATWGFRVAILCGAIALWPWLLSRKAVGDDPPPRERTPHRAAARSRGVESAP